MFDFSDFIVNKAHTTLTSFYLHFYFFYLCWIIGPIEDISTLFFYPLAFLYSDGFVLITFWVIWRFSERVSQTPLYFVPLWSRLMDKANSFSPSQSFLFNLHPCVSLITIPLFPALSDGKRGVSLSVLWIYLCSWRVMRPVYKIVLKYCCEYRGVKTPVLINIFSLHQMISIILMKPIFI